VINLRIEIKFKPRNSKLLPFNYNHYLYSAILERITIVDPELLPIVEAESFSALTFSRLLVRDRKVLPDKGIVLGSTVSLYVSSSWPEIVRTIAKGFRKKPEVKVGDAVLRCNGVKFFREPKFGDSLLFSTLSPVVVRTYMGENSRIRVWDLYPDDLDFTVKLKRIMLRRYLHLFGHLPEERDFSIDVLRFKPVRTLVGNVYYRGSLIVFRFKGSKDIAKFGYENGFGNFTKLGFGMVKVVSGEQKDDSPEDQLYEPDEKH